jgi:hypothetical protein
MTYHNKVKKLDFEVKIEYYNYNVIEFDFKIRIKYLILNLNLITLILNI